MNNSSQQIGDNRKMLSLVAAAASSSAAASVAISITTTEEDFSDTSNSKQQPRKRSSSSSSSPSELSSSDSDSDSNELKGYPFFYYKDFSKVPDPTPSKKFTAATMAGTNFPAKMHIILSDPELQEIGTCLLLLFVLACVFLCLQKALVLVGGPLTQSLSLSLSLRAHTQSVGYLMVAVGES